MEEFIEISSLDNEFEAQLLGGILQERQIPHFIHSFYDEVYGTLFQFQQGWGVVEAASEFKTDIRQILEELRQATTPEEML